MLKAGDIGVTSNWKPGLLSKLSSLIRFFTKSKYSHTLLIQESVGETDTVQEADTTVRVVSFDKYYRDPAEKQTYKMFRIREGIVSQDKIKRSLKKAFDTFAGDSYGFLQLIWFIWRWVNETVFKKDIRHQKNWMTAGVICSELVYYYLWELGEPFQSILAPWNSDTIQAQDVLNIIEAHPELFEAVEEKAQIEPNLIV